LDTVTRITLTNVSVEIPVFDISSSSVRQMLLKKAVGGRIGSSGSHAVVSALQNVTLELNDGDRVGLVGKNGSGKTTLLRVMSKVYPPTQGEIDISGRISAMFSATLGMSMDASGLENIRNCGMLWGLTSDQIENSIDEISEFTELGEYLTMPVRTYSAGMMMRLAFAIATTRDPEILLLDEVIGVGDPAFFRKAFERIKGLIDTSRILVIASHSQPIIRQICNKAIWLKDGTLVKFGDVDQVLAAYQDAQAAA
jgi:ABC-2 type transport system ATP-binding protein/lipopolysaccharide transport system ATP-binding protein